MAITTIPVVRVPDGAKVDGRSPTPAPADTNDGGFNTAAYAAGSVYTVTGTSAAVAFGTTSPIVTLTSTGTYSLRAAATVNLVGATFAANRTLTLKLRRTNNTAADIANSSLAFTVPVVTTLTETLAVVPLPETVYVTTLTNDAVQLFVGLDTVPSAGSMTINGASVVAVLLSN